MLRGRGYSALRNVRPAAVLAGVLVSLALVVLAWVLLPDGTTPGVERSPAWVWLSAALGAHVLGGGLAGYLSRRSPGLNGALSAALCPVLLVAGCVVFYVLYAGVLYGPAGIVPDNLDSLPEAREFVTDEEFFGTVVLALVLTVYTSIAVPVGFVSGSLAGRLRSSPSPADGRSA